MDALVTLVEHANWSVRSAAACAFMELDRSVQEQHAEALVALLQTGVCEMQQQMNLFSWTCQCRSSIQKHW